MIIRNRAFARAGLIGNPSDGYHGKTISLLVRNFRAEVTIYESPRIRFVPKHSDGLEFDSHETLRRDIERNGYYGAVRLLKAAVKRFGDYCQEHGHQLDRCFTVEVETDVPVRVGLAGSSAIVTSTIRALMEFFGVSIPKPVLPNLILSVEFDELKIGAGLQDRVIQVYEGLVFMDFGLEHFEAHHHGRYEPLDPALLPPLYVAYHDNLAEGTEVTHNNLRSRFDVGDPAVHGAIRRWAELAQQARDLLAGGRGSEIGPLMNEGFDLRASLLHISVGNRMLIETGRRLGAFTQFAGSGGAVIGCYDGDPERLARLKQAYADSGATLIVPDTGPLVPA